MGGCLFEGGPSFHDVTVSGYDVTNVYTHPWPALTTPASGFRLCPLLKVKASVEEQLLWSSVVLPSLMAELMEIVHMLDA